MLVVVKVRGFVVPLFGNSGRGCGIECVGSWALGYCCDEALVVERIW